MRTIIALLLVLATSLGGCVGIKVYGPGEPIEASPPAFDVSTMPYEPVDYTSIPSGYTGYVYNPVYGNGTRFRRGGVRFDAPSIHAGSPAVTFAAPPAIQFGRPAISHSPGGAFNFRR